MKIISVDLETMGRDAGCPVLSIALVCALRAAGSNTTEILDSVHAEMDFNAAMSIGSIDPDTVKWWITQRDGPRLRITNGTVAPAAAAVEVSNFLKRHIQGCTIWGNGASFDLTILKSWLKQMHQWNDNWPFWTERDMRTVVDIVERKGFLVRDMVKFDGVPHVALDDATYQAKVICEAMAHLNAL